MTSPLVTAGSVLLDSPAVLASGTALTYEGDEEYAGPGMSLLLRPQSVGRPRSWRRGERGSGRSAAALAGAAALA
jgi:hypothetical protein